MPYASAPEDPALHGVRVLGFPSAARVFERYARLYSAALHQAGAGQRSWVDASDRDSCHLVWIQSMRTSWPPWASCEARTTDAPRSGSAC